MAVAYGVRLLGLMEKPVTLAGLEDMIARRGATEPGLQTLIDVEHAFTAVEVLKGVHRQQFLPYYQPKVSLRTGKVIGMEALARWSNPGRGLVPPSAFISVLELAGRIDELTLLILEGATAACKRMHQRGLSLKVSVNISLVSLTDTSMADRISKVVESSGLAPGFVILEITETAAMTQMAPALENLARLRMRGFGLSVDDFGTGFASLEQLMRVPFTELKIDQNFVTGCGENFASRIIVESSVEMARKLGIASVAEGIESAADWKVVTEAQCDMGQGYLIARPMDEMRFVEFCGAKGAETPSFNP